MTPRCCDAITRRTGAFALVLLLGVIGLVTGCASTPQASDDRDKAAKQFGTHPASATLYVYRIDTSTDDSVLWIGERIIGATLRNTYFRVNLEPGRHVLTGMGHDDGRLPIDVRPGMLYFVALTVAAGQSRFELVPEAIGRKAVTNCCSLLENWAPGQRPLLR
jgi:hypothetical protein